MSERAPPPPQVIERIMQLRKQGLMPKVIAERLGLRSDSIGVARVQKIIQRREGEVFVEVVDAKTGEVVHRVDVTAQSEKQRGMVMTGMDRQLDHERFFTRFSDRKGEAS